jgi:hypothetical protein
MGAEAELGALAVRFKLIFLKGVAYTSEAS